MPWLEDLKFPRGYQMGTHNLNLNNKDVVIFLKKISKKQATITDLTPEIMDWIYKENLEKKIKIMI